MEALPGMPLEPKSKLGLTKLLHFWVPVAWEGSPIGSRCRRRGSDAGVMRTFQYMSPEQWEGKEADARSDLFAFGAILYEMVTGRRALRAAVKAP